MELQRINITPVKLSNQKPTEIKECFISIHDKFLHFRMEFFADEPVIEDDSLSGWKDGVYNFFNIIALKEKIAGIEQSYTKDSKWGVYILVTGFAQDIKAYFNKRSEAEELFTLVQKWLIS